MGGKDVQAAFVVLADPDFESHRQLKLASYSTVQAIRDRFNGVPPPPGNFNGPYFWLSMDSISQDDAWSLA
jgi:hypothetical protein